jgi:hypothetical protein
MRHGLFWLVIGIFRVFVEGVEQHLYSEELRCLRVPVGGLCCPGGGARERREETVIDFLGTFYSHRL